MTILKVLHTILLFIISIILIFFVSDMSIWAIKIAGIYFLFHAFTSISLDKITESMERARDRLKKGTDAIKETSSDFAYLFPRENNWFDRSAFYIEDVRPASLNEYEVQEYMRYNGNLNDREWLMQKFANESVERIKQRRNIFPIIGTGFVWDDSGKLEFKINVLQDQSKQ